MVGLTAVGLLLLLALGTAALPWIMPEQDATARRVAATAIFVTSYLALAIGKVPGLSIDRAGVALVGACLMVAPVSFRWTRHIRRSIWEPSRCCSA